MTGTKKKENVLIVTYWSFKDALIQTYTLPYVRMIRKNIDPNGKIILVTLEQPHLVADEIEKNQIKENLRSQGIDWMPFKYAHFGLTAMIKFVFMIFKLWWVIGQENINTIHTWCTPAGGIGWILSKITRKTLILDSYEPHAEPMVEAGQWDKDSLAFRVLFALEKYQSRHADHAIACVSAMEDYAKQKYDASFQSFYVKPAGVDFNLFGIHKKKNKSLIQKYGLDGKVVFVYAGKFGGSYLEKETFDLLKKAELFYGEKFAAVLLNSHSKEYIYDLATKVGLTNEKIIHAYVTHSEVPDYMGLGDVGLVPFVPVPSKRYGSPIKTAEYLSMGIPVIITKNISDDSQFVMDNKVGFVLSSLRNEEYSKAIEFLDDMIKSDIDLINRCRTSVLGYRNFDQAEKIYERLYRTIP